MLVQLENIVGDIFLPLKQFFCINTSFWNMISVGYSNFTNPDFINPELLDIYCDKYHTQIFPKGCILKSNPLREVCTIWMIMWSFLWLILCIQLLLFLLNLLRMVSRFIVKKHKGQERIISITIANKEVALMQNVSWIHSLTIAKKGDSSN